MDGEAEDVVIVTQVKPLTVLQPVVDHGDGRHVVNHLPRLSVEQVVTAVKAAIPAAKDDITALHPDATGAARAWSEKRFSPVNKLQTKSFIWSLVPLQRTREFLPQLRQVFLVHLHTETGESQLHRRVEAQTPQES